jgi:two-component system, NtrC family, sensor kinase
MKRRSRTGGTPTKGRARNAAKPTARDPPKGTARPTSSSAAERAEVGRLTRELDAALERQAAASEVLQTISRYPGDLQPVFQAMLTNAVRLCDAKFGNIYRWDNGALHLVATKNAPLAFAQARGRLPLYPSQQTPTGRMIATKTVVHATDIRAEKAYADRDPYIVAGVELGGVRTVLMVPMLKDNELIGAFSVYRQEVRPFTDKQIELVKSFAAQAVIAIENARLLNELRQSLEQQTATADVLKVISRSTFDLPSVLDTLVASVAQLSGADMVAIATPTGDGLRHAASYGFPPKYQVVAAQMPIPFGRGSIAGRVVLEGKSVQILDIEADPEYELKEAIKVGGVNTMLGVPLLREGSPIGVMVLQRRAKMAFTDKQIELAETFADQAVIAIENARLLNELRQRSTDLAEALEQQTATSEVLRVISSSAGELTPVFATMLENAARICSATFGNIFGWDGDALDLIATYNTPATLAEARKNLPLRPTPDDPVGRVLKTKTAAHITDLAAEAGYIERTNQSMIAAVELGGARTIVLVPMLKEREPIGLFSLYRQEVRPFTDKQIELVKNFAAQAVIAIENARLLNELRQRTDDLSQRTTDLSEALEQQTATSEVLQVISTSPGDLEPVFTTMLEKAVRICDASFGNIYRWDGEFLNHIAAHNTPVALLEVRRRQRIRFSLEDPVGQMVTNKNVVHTADLTEERGYIERSNAGVVDAVELGGIRTHVVVPMLKDDELIGTFHLSRQEVRPFTDKQIELVTNFAAQAVIAIENTRLLNELRERTREVEKLNQDLEHRVSDQVDEIERMSRLRRFLPPQVADLIVASGTEKQLESHRREITALFCDLRGFTGFTESADAEDVIALLREYHAALGEKIIKYSGTLERYAGDGVMVVFNDPVPVENPALQAVLMALELREAIGALTATWSRLGHEIGFGIGIAHGFATLGTIGFEGRFDYAAIGTVSNVASRLCDEAKPGQILISPRVLMKVENAVKVEPVGEFELKGIRRPLAAYNVVGAASAQT